MLFFVKGIYTIYTEPTDTVVSSIVFAWLPDMQIRMVVPANDTCDIIYLSEMPQMAASSVYIIYISLYPKTTHN